MAKLLATMQSVANKVIELHNREFIKIAGLYLYRWALIMTISSVVVKEYRIDNIFSMIKIWLIGAFL